MSNIHPFFCIYQKQNSQQSQMRMFSMYKELDTLCINFRGNYSSFQSFITKKCITYENVLYLAKGKVDMSPA